MREKMLKILMLEDSTDDIDLIERVLRRSKISFVAEHADSRAEFTESLRTFEPDVVLSDHGLPQFNSKEALRICLKQRSSMPFIIVTGTMSDEFAIECIREGADDYILKSNLSRLPAALLRAIKIKRLEKLKREARHALRKQNEELLKVNKELDNFVYSLSHNFRAPLTSMLGLINIARLMDPEKDVENVYAMMSSSIQQLEDTLKETLHFSRNARTPVLIEKIDFQSVLAKSMESIQTLPDFDTVSVLTHINSPLPFYSDSRRIRAIFINLLTNSIHYANFDDKPILSIDIDVTDESCMIKITDNGIGIEPEILPKVFNMFYRGTERSKGAGLGLYITKEVVKRLDGDISIRSTPGVGTEVILAIPQGKHSANQDN